MLVRMKDIALKAGVSTATVSNVLNNSGRVGKKTRKKVLKVIEELNYTPNKIARSLKLQKTNTVGVIAEDVTVFNTPSIIDGINKMAELNDLGILLVNLRLFQKAGTDFSNKEHMRKILGHAFNQLVMNQVDGIIYIGTYKRDMTDIIPPLKLPVVYTYCVTSNKDDFAINYDDEEAAYRATQYLIDLGHKDIGLISGMSDSIHSHERFDGYCRALKENGISLNSFFIKTGDWEVKSGYQLTKELLRLDKRPTAIVSLNDLMAFGAINAAQDLGLNVPRDISVIGFDNREFSAYTTPKLATMEIPLGQLGKKSLTTLQKLINQQPPDRTKINLTCTLIERESVSHCP